ncbi:hypothetical protein [Marinobacter zhanjiangensis]|uniref:Membrane protein n=1 Tax=Marinobacter zhanjiangensis TaxID=578215 RepID=A0ABQ3B8T1_9GAMM|nr:hypothetical protein [Marinobacter zhanjiangensis]GGY82782.1 membrane protein [Marinobacter zhanjiangensis]
MGHIIAARLETQENAEELANAIQGLGIAHDKVSVFYVNPEGQHHLLPEGGDKSSSPGASRAARGAWVGGGIGAAAGAAAGSVAGPAGAVAGAGVGAYTGSLAGAVSKTDNEAEAADKADEDTPVVDRKAGIHVAVEVDRKTRQDVVTLIRQHDGEQIEEAQGQIKKGEWVDFDPTEPVRLVT